jgi:hypothetical protein
MEKRTEKEFQVPECLKQEPEELSNIGIFSKLSADRIRTYSNRLTLISAGMMVVSALSSCSPPGNNVPFPTPSVTAASTPTITPNPVSGTVTPTPTTIKTPTPSSTVIPTPTRTPSSTVTPTPTRTPSSTVTPTPTRTPSGTVTPTPTGSVGYNISLEVPVCANATSIFKIQVQKGEETINLYLKKG